MPLVNNNQTFKVCKLYMFTTNYYLKLYRNVMTFRNIMILTGNTFVRECAWNFILLMLYQNKEIWFEVNYIYSIYVLHISLLSHNNLWLRNYSGRYWKPSLLIFDFSALLHFTFLSLLLHCSKIYLPLKAKISNCQKAKAFGN